MLIKQQHDIARNGNDCPKSGNNYPKNGCHASSMNTWFCEQWFYEQRQHSAGIETVERLCRPMGLRKKAVLAHFYIFSTSAGSISGGN